MTTDRPTLDEQMAEAVRRQAAHAAASRAVDRRGWTGKRWVEDARQLMDDTDGSVLDLVNGHVMALLDRIERLEADRAGLSDETKHWCGQVVALEKRVRLAAAALASATVLAGEADARQRLEQIEERDNA